MLKELQSIEAIFCQWQTSRKLEKYKLKELDFTKCNVHGKITAAIGYIMIELNYRNLMGL